MFLLQVTKDKKEDSSKADLVFDALLTKSLPNKHHEFLLALVYLFQVVYELRELDVSVMRHKKRLSGFTEELDELTIVPWADVSQPRVRCVNVSPNRGIQ